MAGQPQREWTDNDQALLYTVHLVADLLADRPMRPAPVRTPFPPQYSREEKYLASSNFTLLGPRLLVQFLFDSAPTGPCWRVPDRLVATGPGAVVVGTLTGYHHLLMGNSRR